MKAVVSAFEGVLPQIDSSRRKLASNQVLAHTCPGLTDLGFTVETGKKRAQKINVPVLFGANGKVEKSFEADAYHKEAGFVLEVEAGRAVVNNQFLKDLFQACMMREVHYLAIAVRNIYGGGGHDSKDFDRVVTFFDTLYASDRLTLPLEGIMVIGY